MYFYVSSFIVFGRAILESLTMDGDELGDVDSIVEHAKWEEKASVFINFLFLKKYGKMYV